MLVPLDALPIWLRAARFRSVAIRGLWSLISASSYAAPANTPRMFHDVDRTLSFGVTAFPPLTLARRMALQR